MQIRNSTRRHERNEQIESSIAERREQTGSDGRDDPTPLQGGSQQSSRVRMTHSVNDILHTTMGAHCRRQLRDSLPVACIATDAGGAADAESRVPSRIVNGAHTSTHTHRLTHTDRERERERRTDGDGWRDKRGNCQGLHVQRFASL